MKLVKQKFDQDNTNQLRKNPKTQRQLTMFVMCDEQIYIILSLEMHRFIQKMTLFSFVKYTMFEDGSGPARSSWRYNLPGLSSTSWM
jgi:hypothetical protein